MGEERRTTMPSFLENLRPFYGTNEKNAAGESLEEFLEHYDPYKYRTPSCTTDAVIFLAPEHLTKELKGMRVLLVKRSNHPSIGFWALPGGFIEMRENLDDTARRELLEETSVDGLVMEQIGTYGDYDRDPRTRVITTAYMAVLQGEERQVRAGDDAADAVWCDLEVEEIPVQTGGGQTDGDANETKRGDGGFVTEFTLHVTNPERGLDTSALVEYRRRGTLVREESFSVKEAGMIAVDHAAIIVQALSVLKSRL